MLRQGVLGVSAGKAASPHQALRDLPRRQMLDPCGGELERERQPVELVADPHHGSRGRRSQCEARIGSRSTVYEKPCGVGAHHRRHVASGLGKPERREREHTLPGKAERRTAGAHDPDLGCDVQQPQSQAGDLAHHVFAVVDHQHDRTGRQPIGQHLHLRKPGPLADTETAHQRAHDSVGATDRRQLHDDDLRGLGAAPQAGGEFARHPRLTATACARHRDQPIRSQGDCQRQQLALATDQWPLRQHRRRSSQKNIPGWVSYRLPAGSLAGWN
jgi:hypothetical protein